MAHLTADPSKEVRWVCLYPTYLDANKTIPQGRRVPKDKAVKAPTLKEIKLVLDTKRCGLKYKIESKQYPRDFMQIGRFRVQLKNGDGTPCNEAIPNRKALMQFVAEGIPKLAERQAAEKQARAQAQAAAKAQTVVTSKKRKKKGKGK